MEGSLPCIRTTKDIQINCNKHYMRGKTTVKQCEFDLKSPECKISIKEK